ncbi:MAG: 4'-phosphopantetheinyl transferase superfamily protein [Oscillospiraceae bacterium]|jgi:4'-phosphopantetheinyl transferase|nr:4'-phosphopantetheinyl transferase superfamily protein [Oscillospiraceae bacterium]
MGECYFIEINEDIKKFGKFLCKTERDSINLKRNSLQVSSKIAAIILKKCIFCRELKIPYEDLVFSKSVYGKPFLKNQNFHYNISHTIGAAVLAVSNTPIGIDIEKVRDVNLKIAKRFFHDIEEEKIFAHPENQLRRFLYVWTRKEAYLKYQGIGLHRALSSFNIYNLETPVTTIEHGEFIFSICKGTEISNKWINLSLNELFELANCYLKSYAQA